MRVKRTRLDLKPYYRLGVDEEPPRYCPACGLDCGGMWGVAQHLIESENCRKTAKKEEGDD